MRNCVTAFLTLALAAFILAGTASAQISGDIQVTVTDPSGAVVPGAHVTVKNNDTGTTRTGTSDSTGVARFTNLTVGNYQVKVEASGFAAMTSQTVVNSGAIATVAMSLQVKTATQEVLVSEAAVQLNTVNSQLQNTDDSRRVMSLPTSSGGVLVLAGTAPGVTPVSPRNPFLGLGSFNSNGGRGRGNNITIDNAVATDVSTTGAAGLGTVPLDAIKEFNVITNNFSAEFGRNSDAQVQILTKSGGNQFHGDLFEYFRNDKLNSRDYFDRTGSPAVLRNNDWGATAGGPVKKDKVFFFGTYEQNKIRGAGAARIATVPTPAQVSGNIDPTAAQLLKTLLVPTSPSGTVSSVAPNTTNSWALSGRVDANLTDKDYFFVRYGIQDSKAASAGLTFIDSALATNGASSTNKPQQVSISETHTFSPNTVNYFLSSYGRSLPNFPTLYNFGLPEIQFNDGTANFGTWDGLPQGRTQNTFQYSDSVSHAMGKHLFKFGGDLHRIQSNDVFDSNVNGTMVFLTLNDFLQ